MLSIITIAQPTSLYILDTFYVVYIVHVTYENQSVSQTVVCKAHIILSGGYRIALQIYTVKGVQLYTVKLQCDPIPPTKNDVSLTDYYI